MTIILGLTGSIGMGKTTTAALFADAGLPVWDADAAVHRLYAPGGAAVDAVGAEFPEAVRGGGLSRAVLKDIIARDPSALTRIEAIVHPLVAADRAAFLAEAGADIVVLDVPLLFETGLDRACDRVAVVSAGAATQRARVLDRPGMTEDQFDRLLARQMPDAEKRARADFVIPTETMDDARQAVAQIIAALRKGLTDA